MLCACACALADLLQDVPMQNLGHPNPPFVIMQLPTPWGSEGFVLTAEGGVVVIRIGRNVFRICCEIFIHVVVLQSFYLKLGGCTVKLSCKEPESWLARADVQTPFMPIIVPKASSPSIKSSQASTHMYSIKSDRSKLI